ncbi:MAG: hypothetical protein WB696_11585, partial [Chthoniobacterales bacterium]
SETAGSPANPLPVGRNTIVFDNGSRPNWAQLYPRSGGLGETRPTYTDYPSLIPHLRFLTNTR